jgi:N-acetylglutamate synthase-like GNAT family acetyltransferase|tara:strand:+ start:134 stop:589 length:456 start_codon:yes stop_codon:yes gene_type:complete
MKIREANKFDLPEVIAMLRDFRGHTPIDMMKDCDNEEYVNKMFHHILLGGGVAFIAEKDGVAVGMIAGVKDHNIWDPDLKMLRELVFWVKEEHRGSTAGYKLIKAYNKKAEELIDEDKIKMYTMTKMTSSPDLDFSRFGYTKSEEVWVAGI